MATHGQGVVIKHVHLPFQVVLSLKAHSCFYRSNDIRTSGVKDPEIRVVGVRGRQDILDQGRTVVATLACPALQLQPSRALLFASYQRFLGWSW